MPKIKPKAPSAVKITVEELFIDLEAFRRQKEALIHAQTTAALLSSSRAKEDVDALEGVIGLWDWLGDEVMKQHPHLKATDVFPIESEDLRD